MPRYDLLSIESDSKTKKGNLFGFLTAILYLAPYMEAGGRNMCPKATAECIAVCLNSAGMAGVFPSIRRARVAKTRAYLADPLAFMERLDADVVKLKREAKSRGLTPAARFNGTSDDWKLAHAMAKRHTDLQVYDYTKLDKPWLRTLPNYHLTYSFSGNNLAMSLEALKHGINVAVVFTGGLPETWNGYRVIDGDKSDLRFTDPTPVIVGLKAKGLARKIEAGGFVQIGGDLGVQSRRALGQPI